MCSDPINETTALGALLPREVNGWKAEEDRIYDPQTIFTYLNGSGEVYRAFNFRILLARHFNKTGQPKIIADLFDMASDKDAFGIFSHGFEGYDVGIGQGSSYTGGLLSFWKGRFFVSLFAEEETDEAKEALLAMGSAAASAIKDSGLIPDIVSLFPLRDLDQSKIRFFHSYIILNQHFFVADENILCLGQQTDGALGTYHEQGDEYHLLLIRYSGGTEAARAFKSFVSAYMPDATEPGMVRTEDGKWTAARLKEDLLIIVFSAFSDSHARDILNTFNLNYS